MASAGTVTVDFAAETSKFTAELKKVRNDLGDLRSSSDRTRDAFSSFGSTLRNIAGFVAIGSLTRSIVRATSEAEAAFAQLDAAVKSTGAVAGFTADELAGMSSALQSTTTFADDAIQSMQAVLLTFTRIRGPEFQEAQQAILDLSTRLGTDLKSSATQVGKALNDPINGLAGLARAGIQFSDAQKKVIKDLVLTGNVAGAQRLILEQLEKKFGGAAEAARNTFGGALKGVQNALGDLLEVKGGLPGATESLNEFTRILQDPATKQAADALFSTILTGAAKTVEFFGKIISGLQAFAGEGSNEVVNLDIKIQELTVKRDALLKSNKDIFGRTLLGPGPQAEVDRLNKQIDDLLRKQRQLLQLGEFPATKPQVAGASTPSGPTDEDIAAAKLAADEAAKKKFFDDMEERQIAYQKETQMRLELEKQVSDFIRETGEESNNQLDESIERYQRDAEERIEIERYAQEAIRQERNFTTSAAIGLLQTLGAKNKAFAALAIAIEKAQAIQRILVQNQVAAELAFASQLIPGDPTSLGRAAAAKAAVLAQGRLAAAFVAATGVFQIANTFSAGGNAPGSPGNPVFTTPAGDQQVFGASSQNVIQIQINGYIGREQIDQMVDALQEEINERDVVIIQPNGSAQHSALNA